MQLQNANSALSEDCRAARHVSEATEIVRAPSFSDIELVYAPTRPRNSVYRHTDFDLTHFLSGIILLGIIAWSGSFLLQERPTKPVLVIDRSEMIEKQVTPNLRFGRAQGDNPVTSLVYLGALAKIKRERERASR